MKSSKRFIAWQTWLFCLLTCLCALALRPANAQLWQPQTTEIPGVPAGYTIVEGDIQVPLSELDAWRNQSRVGRPQATLDTKLWPNGIVPFRFETTCAKTSNCTNAPTSGCVSTANRAAMRAAMQVLELAANVDFVECPYNSCTGNLGYNFITVRDSTNDTTADSNNVCQDAAKNSSPVGRQSSVQTINITSWDDQFIIVHELLHSLGFYHEQSRPDRNNFVDVANFCNNVEGGCMGTTYGVNFKVEGLPYAYYDFDSVMHYGQCSFSRNAECPKKTADFPDGGITIKVNSPYDTQLSPDGKTNWQEAIGQRDRLSALDRLAVSFLYPRPNWRFVDANYDGANGAPNGTVLRPFQSLAAGLNDTPAGGVIWLQPGTYFTSAPLSKTVALRAPFGNVNIRRP